MTRRDWRLTLRKISLWNPPEGIRAMPMMDDCGYGMIHVRMELGTLAKVIYVPNNEMIQHVHSLLNDCAMQLLIEADPMSPLELAAAKFEDAMAEIGGKR